MRHHTKHLLLSNPSPYLDFPPYNGRYDLLASCQTTTSLPCRKTSSTGLRRFCICESLQTQPSFVSDGVTKFPPGMHHAALFVFGMVAWFTVNFSCWFQFAVVNVVSYINQLDLMLTANAEFATYALGLCPVRTFLSQSAVCFLFRHSPPLSCTALILGTCIVHSGFD